MWSSKCAAWATHCHASDSGPNAAYWRAQRDAVKRVDFVYAARLWFKSVGLDAPSRKGAPSVGRFLNRLLGLTLTRQGLLFDYFAAMTDLAVRQARREGKYDEAVMELRGRTVKLVEETVVCPPTAEGGGGKAGAASSATSTSSSESVIEKSAVAISRPSSAWSEDLTRSSPTV